MVNFTAIFSHHLDALDVCNGAAFLNLHWPKAGSSVSMNEAFSFFEKQDDYWQWEPRWEISPWEDLQQSGYATFVGHGEPGHRGRYEVITAERNNLVDSLKRISDYAKSVLKSDGRLYILHMGI